MKVKRKATEKELEWVRQWRKDNAEYINQKKREKYLANQEEIKAKSKAYREANKEKVKEAKRKKYLLNREAVLAKQRAYYQANKNKVKARIKKCREKTDYATAYGAKRHAAKMDRVPNWLTDDDHARIREIYAEMSELNKTTDEEYCVDHIIPLQGAIVSGLHVPENLQILTKSENSIKRNKFEI